MRIITANKEIIPKLKEHDITYFFNDNDDIDELLDLSEICHVTKEIDKRIMFDIAIDCENIQAFKTCTSKESIDEILKPIEKEKDYKFSVIIPNYNYSKWLDKCLNSVLNQTYKNYEIIFIDDMSTDNSVEIARNLLRTQDKIIQLNTRRLNGGTRNEGLINATGDYIVFLDSDDWLINNKVLEEYNEKLFGQDVMFVGVEKIKFGVFEKIWGLTQYKDKYEAMASGHSGACFKVIKRELALKCMFNEGTLMEDRNHHCRVCYYMKTFTQFGKVSHIWNRDNESSVLTVRDKALWGTCTYRNYADCKQFLLEILPDNDRRAIGILNDRLKRIKIDIYTEKDFQH